MLIDFINKLIDFIYKLFFLFEEQQKNRPLQSGFFIETKQPSSQHSIRGLLKTPKSRLATEAKAEFTRSK
jgi:hypothetical protein